MLLTRPEEFEAAARVAPVPGAALELLPVDADTAAAYLVAGHATASRGQWEMLAAHVRNQPGSPVAIAFETPLMLSLVRASYPSPSQPTELIMTERFPSARAVEDRVLDRIIASAYPEPQRRSSRYSSTQARAWLGFAASRMRDNGMRDLDWWRIHRWAPGWLVGTLLGCVLFTVAMVTMLGLYGATGSVDSMESLYWYHVDWGTALLSTTAQFGMPLFSLGLVLGLGGFGYTFQALFSRGRDISGRRLGEAVLLDLRGLGLLVLVPTGFVVIVALIRPDPYLTLSSLLSMCWDYMFQIIAPLICIALMLRVSGVGSDMPLRLGLGLPNRRELVTGVQCGAIAGIIAVIVYLLTDIENIVYGWKHVSIVRDLLLAPSPLILVGIVIGLVSAVAAGLVWAGARTGIRGTPAAMWRTEIRNAVSLGTGFAVLSWLMFPIGNRNWGSIFWAFLPLWIALWLSAALASTHACRLGVAGLLLRAEGRAPFRIIRFLEDARARQVLRMAGVSYQFRHGRLQDRLAAEYRARSAPDDIESPVDSTAVEARPGP